MKDNFYGKAFTALHPLPVTQEMKCRSRLYKRFNVQQKTERSSFLLRRGIYKFRQVVIKASTSFALLAHAIGKMNKLTKK